MKNTPVKRVNMLILMQPDLEAAVTFYSELGLTKKFHLKEKWAEFDVQGVSLGLCPISATDLPDRRTGIVLEVEDLRALHQELIDYIQFVGEPVEAVHGLMVSFRDPGGNILDLYQPTPEKVQDLVKETVEKEKKSSSSCCSQKEAS